jgi:hypothetical protein
MLPIVYSIALGHAAPIVFDQHQQIELVLTIAQATVGAVFLIDMRLTWKEATALLVLFAVPFANAEFAKPVAAIYFVWAAAELCRMALGRRKPRAFTEFGKLWRLWVRPGS